MFSVITMMFLHLPQMAARQDAVHNTYAALVEVDALAKQRFVETIRGDDHLVHGAIRGVLLQLDPYSGYIAPRELAAFERRSGGDYIGIGIEIGMRSGRLTVISPVDGSPAARVGVRAGDTIRAIDGSDTEGMSVFDAEDLLVGAPDTQVQLTVQHVGEPEPEVLTMTRGWVNLVTVRGFRRDGRGRWGYMIDADRRIGYIRVSSFLHTTIRDFNIVLDKLAARDAAGLIIDLRFDPGGLMHQALAMVDRFVDRGVILSTVTRRQAVQEFEATSSYTEVDLALVVLINGASASSSEIVAGSLQDHRRATIIGERSFGKGSVQQLIYLRENQGAVKLTTAYYRLPGGRIIHRTKKNQRENGWGVIPDIVVPLNEEEVATIQASRMALDRANIATDRGPASSRKATLVSAATDDKSIEIHRDRQLLVALSHLKKMLANY